MYPPLAVLLGLVCAVLRMLGASRLVKIENGKVLVWASLPTLMVPPWV